MIMVDGQCGLTKAAFHDQGDAFVKSKNPWTPCHGLHGFIYRHVIEI